MEAVVQAISEPPRREIHRLIRDRERAAGELAAQFEVTRSAVSQHLPVLKNPGQAAEQEEGRGRVARRAKRN